LGLAIIRERAAAIDAGLCIASAPDQGTAVEVVWAGQSKDEPSG
jgi:signal transduction histidine kinase